MAFRIALAQIGSRVGDVDGNVQRILDAWQRAADLDSDLVVFTELAVPGYPPEDLLLKPEFVAANLDAVARLAAQGPAGTVAVVGHVGRGEEQALGSDTAPDRAHWDVALATRNLTNAAAVLSDGRVAATYDKLRLPNYGVFDEARYFTPRDQPCLVDVGGVPVGITICEDLWTEEGPVHAAAAAGARVIANLNASPYHRGKRADREARARHHTTRDGTWLAYVNVVGGQDEVVFDGDSFLMGPDGDVIARAAQFTEDLVVVDVPVDGEVSAEPRPRATIAAPVMAARLDPVGEVWHALVRATRDYCHHNGFTHAVLGLSGGIDSSVTAAVAVDALGAEHVTGVLMPSRYSSDHSISDALSLVDALGMPHHLLPISDPVASAAEVLGDLVVTGFDGAWPPARNTSATRQRPGIAYENMQSRMRGLLLMALSNEHNWIVLTTGNKSEYAVGYATIYGDMAGGFAPLRDVPKMLVYQLAHWRNRDGEVIPKSTIAKPPSAELRPGQRDQDTLPPYEVLDDIIEAYVEDDLALVDIVARGHDEETVRRVLRMIDRAEYKRRQAAPGPKITPRAFGRDRRVPITNLWRG